MINFYEVKKEDIKEHNPNWPEISDHLYIVLIIGDSGSGQTFFLISHRPDIDKI